MIVVGCTVFPETLQESVELGRKFFLNVEGVGVRFMSRLFAISFAYGLSRELLAREKAHKYGLQGCTIFEIEAYEPPASEEAR